MPPSAALTRRDLLQGLPFFAASRKLSIRSLTTRKHTIGNRDYPFLELETDGGITGIGEGSVSGRVEIVERAIQWFTPFLTGKDAAGIEGSLEPQQLSTFPGVPGDFPSTNCKRQQSDCARPIAAKQELLSVRRRALKTPLLGLN